MTLQDAETVVLEPETPRPLKASIGPSDRIFRGLSRGGGIVVLAIMSLVGVFLATRALDALRQAGFSFVTTETWEPDGGHFGIAAVLTGTLLVGTVAIIVAVPLALGTALYISEYAPPWLKRTLISLVDLMAAVPSVGYRPWGVCFPQAHGAGGPPCGRTHWSW